MPEVPWRRVLSSAGRHRAGQARDALVSQDFSYAENLKVAKHLKRSREPAGVCSPEVGQARVG